MSDMGSAPPVPPAPAMSGGYASENSKLIALLGWLFAPWGLIAIFLDDYKNDKFVRSHVIQAAAYEVVLWVIYAVLGATLILIPLLLLVGLADIIYRILMGLKAYKGGEVAVPVVYGFVKNLIDQV